MPRCAHDDCGRWRPTWLAPWALWFDGEWFCRATCLRQHTAARLRALEPEPAPTPPSARFKLGTLLVADKVISQDVLDEALRRQQQSGLRLGAQLLAMGAIESDVLTQVLARQGNVRCVIAVSDAQVALTVDGISRSVVQALGVVPLDLDVQGVLRVAVCAPVPRLALRVLERMTGRRIEAYLVADTTLVTLTGAYGALAPDDHGVRAASPDEAAMRITSAASAGRAEGWRCVPSERFTWIRLEGSGGTNDIIIDPNHGGGAWQAASIRH